MRGGLSWLIETVEGRRVLLTVYSLAAVVSVVIYSIVRSPAYAAALALLLVFAPLWARWCVNRR